MAGVGQWLDWMISGVFSSLIDSVVVIGAGACMCELAQREEGLKAPVLHYGWICTAFWLN